MGKRLQTAAAVTCIKIMLMIFNVIFWLTGGLLIAIGVWVKTSLNKYMELSGDQHAVVPYVIIGIGGAIVVVGTAGFCCTYKAMPKLLYAYSVFLMVIFLAEIGAAIVGYKYRNQIKEGFHTGVQHAVDSYENSAKNYPEHSKVLDDMQKTLHCCGSGNYTDWFGTKWAAGETKVPESCCKKEKCATLVPAPANTTQIYTEGCYDTVVNYMAKNIKIIGGAALGVAFFQFLGVVLACCLGKHANKAKYERVS